MTPEETSLQDQAEELKKEQEKLLREREELEQSNQELNEVGTDLSETQTLLRTIKEDIQGIHSDNEKLKHEIAALGSENSLLKQAVNLPEGSEGEQIMKTTVAELEALSSHRPSSTGSNVIWQADVRNQREELRGEREDLLTERARLRTEASQLCGKLQVTMKDKFPGSEVPADAPLAGVLEEYGTLCGEAGDLQAEHDRLKMELDAVKADVDPAVEKKERDQLRRELTSQMLKYTFFPPKAEISTGPTVRVSQEVKEGNQHLKFKTKDMLGQLMKAGKSSGLK